MSSNSDFTFNGEKTSKVYEYIAEWKSRLIDLSRRNKLLYFKHSARGNLLISSPDAETVFNRIVNKKRGLEFWMPPEDATKKRRGAAILDLTGYSERPSTGQLVCEDVPREDLERMLKKFNRRSLSDYRERGVRILYCAFGMLNWRDFTTNEDVQSPIVMVPVELSRKSVWEPFTLAVPPVEERIIPNPALQVKLKADYKIELPPFPENGDGSSLTDYLHSVAISVEKFGWTLTPTLEIGLFSFHKLVIYKDLESNAISIGAHPIIRAIAGIKDTKLVMDDLPDERDVDSIENPEKTFRVLDADSSQRISIDYALQGQSFVMQGPPGTGKSQTIANIISECIARGKSVLFVSDKMAALEVVYKRLNDVGLAPFCLELHSSKANKQEVVAELMQSLNEQLIPRRLPSFQDFDKLNSLRNKLNKYVSSLHTKHPDLQMSPYEVLSELTSLEQTPSVPVGLPNIATLTPQRLHELENLVSDLSGVWRAVEEKDFPWQGYRGNTYSLEVRSELSTFLESVISQVNTLKNEATEYARKLGLKPPETFTDVNWLIEISRLLKESPKPEARWMTDYDAYELIEEAKTHQDMFLWRQATRNLLTETFTDAIFSLSPNKSTEIEQALEPLRPLLVAGSVEEGQLLQQQAKLAQLLATTPETTDKWEGYAKDLATHFELPGEDLTFERIEQLARTANLCFAEDKPLAKWFEPDVFQQMKEIVPIAKSDFQERNILYTQISKTYDDRIYTLDLDEFVMKYNGPYRGFSRRLRPSYYRDQKQIARFTREGKVPRTVLKDLIDARRVKALETELNGYKERLQTLLGPFYEGFNTDFQKIENALETTSETKKITSPNPVPENLIKLISNGFNPPQQIRWIGVALQQSAAEWRSSVEDLSPIIPISFFPNSKVPIYATPLAQIRDWADNTANQLSRVLSLVANVLNAIRHPLENYKQILEDLKTAETVRRKENEFLAEKNLLKAKFGSRFQEFDTNWEEAISALEWTKKAQAVFGENKMPEPFARTVAGGSETAPSDAELIKYSELTTTSLITLESNFESESTYQGKKLNEAKIEAVLNRIVALRDRVDELRVWIDFKDAKDRFSLAGMASFFARLLEKQFPNIQLVSIFRKGALQEWINNLYLENDSLGQFRRENHEQAIADFRRVDQELIHLSPNRVIDVANSRKPQDILIQADDSEIGVLLKESAKKRRLMPIRSLLQRIPNLLPRLKPCLLMSPISVSQFLTPDLMKFDLVLYDEASQIVPEDAIGSIYRGKTIVVAGDNKQLPPTSFFQKSLIEDIDWDEMTEGDVEVFDSILDECLGIGLPVKTLRWHYRSRHESLIAFSNDRFYNGTLITFPAAMQEHEALGVKLFQVKDAIYDRGGKRDNPREAEIVADLVFEHFKKHPEKTLGVVTFSISQMETVEEAIERRLREHPEFEHFFREDRLEGFFVKNLENVQGDERDAIVFSVGYGRDNHGQMTLNFGPLNKSGGERRLNVAVTRAREKVILVTSIKSSDITVNPSSATGVLALRGYLEYAEKKRHAEKTGSKESKLDSAIEDAVAAEIQEMDYEVTAKVGHSLYPIDIGVADPAKPGCYLLGIECDGVTYRASNSARDRDRLREQVLKQLGWKIHRIWSPDWVARRESEVRRLKDALEGACQLQSTLCSPQATLPYESKDYAPQVVDVRQVQFAGSERIGVPYRVHVLKAGFNPYVRVAISKYPYSAIKKNEFHFPENRVLQSRLLEELVREEGPIHFDYAAQRLASAWEVKRVGPKIAQSVREALEMLVKDHRITVKGDFLWPNDLVDAPVRVPVPEVTESMRPPEHIPPEEIESGMQLIAKYAIGITVESLIAETAKVFGFTHPGERTREALSEVYNKMLRERKLVNVDGTVKLP